MKSEIVFLKGGRAEVEATDAGVKVDFGGIVYEISKKEAVHLASIIDRAATYNQ